MDRALESAVAADQRFVRLTGPRRVVRTVRGATWDAVRESVCVCGRERDTQRDRERQRPTERASEREREREGGRERERHKDRPTQRKRERQRQRQRQTSGS